MRRARRHPPPGSFIDDLGRNWVEEWPRYVASMAPVGAPAGGAHGAPGGMPPAGPPPAAPAASPATRRPDSQGRVQGTDVHS
ncbi:hypothetical protein LUW74_41205 [Actinomadura madurae]|uniref:hypothetical protein n=1 Tax=Actinomadura madurae TaxID=1993 RepID=UPI0020273ACE|nr:hypothetical protein LUW74_41205 [Actinomadura madurae]